MRNIQHALGLKKKRYYNDQNRVLGVLEAI